MDVTIASPANAVILVALNVSADGMKSKSWWKFLEGESILSRLKDGDIMASRTRNLLYTVLIRFCCGPLGKGVRMELLDYCLKGVRSLLRLQTCFLNILNLVVVFSLFYYGRSFQ